MFLIAYNRQNPNLICFPFLLCHPHEMFRTDIAKRRCLAFFRMMKTETALLHHSARLRIAVIIPAPDGGHFQIFKASLQQAAYGFGYQPLSPIWLAYPITYFCFVKLHFGTMQTIPKHDAYASNRFIGFFQDYCVSFRSGKDGADYIQAILHRSVRWPACDRPDCRVLGRLQK